MPANLNHAYYEAEERYRQAVSREEKLVALKEMLRVMPKHKGTDKLQADLKSRIAKLKRQPEKKGPATGRPSYRVQKEGAGQVALVGPPNSGKSSLVEGLTHAEPEVAAYPLTTREPTPGMMPFEDVAFQLVDLPPVCDEYVEFWVWDNIRGADLVWLVLSSDDLLEGMETAERLLAEKALGMVPWNGKAPEEPRPGWTYKPTVMVVTGIDRAGSRDDLEVFLELIDGAWPPVAVSNETREGLEELGRVTYRALDIVRVYSKQPGKDADMDQPFTLPRGATVEDLVRKIHKDLLEDFHFARVWGESTHDGQRVPASHVLEEGDVVEVHA